MPEPKLLSPEELEPIRERAEAYEAPGLTKHLRAVMLRQDLRVLLGHIEALQAERDALAKDLSDAISQGGVNKYAAK